MYAVIKTGGKQYRVTAGQILEVEKLEGSVGDSISIEEVLMVADGDDITIGQPAVDGARVVAKITGQYRGKKILSFRYRPKKRIRVRKGHRQYLTRLEIESLSFGDKTYDVSAAKADAAAKIEAAAPKIEEPVASLPETADSDVETAADLGNSAVDAGTEATESTVDAVVETASEAVETVADVADSASDAVADAAEEVEEKVEDAVDAADATDKPQN